MVEERALRRQGGMIAGICEGLGVFYGLDPWWFRLGFIILALPGGLPGILLYAIMWIVIPQK
jgi:phage shock protein C